ncbi:hypothetical protein [Streptomyces sp. NPDC002889]|uniref:hypothetical protein n=1 Tax=Streptomyces sp. NPDC002889 TaxID=3364669 RepID=UPI0036868413
MTTTIHGSPTDKNLDATCASVANEIIGVRADGKASLLLAFNGAVLAGLASVTDKELPLPTKVFGALAVPAARGRPQPRRPGPACAGRHRHRAVTRRQR